ncbi:replication/maintenance protein RepL [Nocardiopsis sp. HNM0947]|uniref:Replication/maintenance protein RepL n=1 Tax=Nocardiopsis coralli TaxID=2772213 RepID=A0ABR9PB03_9ACTN|nr:helix-turn-helix domain-containing protein [Nocardiopsis coralli]MBE3001021.1 replication/maintenance protein RepL [Nocardiopsis coralli]
MGQHARQARTSETPETTPAPPPVQPLKLGRGDKVVVERRQRPANYDFVGGAFQQISRALFTIVKHFDLGRREILILLLLGLEQEHGTARVRMTQSEMADKLEIHRTDVSNLLGNLREIGLVMQVKRGIYQLHPRVFFAGSSDQQAEVLAELPPDVLAFDVPMDGEA